MKRFIEGDLAITCNTKMSHLNDGHLVRILEVVGPVPNLDLAFAYRVERVDGGLLYTGGTENASSRKVLASQSKLRPLRGPSEHIGSETPEEVCA